MNKFKGITNYKKTILGIMVIAILLLMNTYGHDSAHYNLTKDRTNIQLSMEGAGDGS